MVSIHAPWEGCDHIDFSDIKNGRKFQFTHPGKGATEIGVNQLTEEELFQFTHPGKGATQCNVVVPAVLGVSIHAPWEGCDQRASRSLK